MLIELGNGFLMVSYTLREDVCFLLLGRPKMRVWAKDFAMIGEDLSKRHLGPNGCGSVNLGASKGPVWFCRDTRQMTNKGGSLP